MRRILLLASMLACAVSAIAQDAAQKITYRAEAIPLKTVCEELTQKTGITFGTTGTLNSMIMVIDVRDVTVQELMDRLAQAVEAEWFKDGSTTRLMRNAAYIRKKEDEAYRGLVETISQTQAKKREALAKISSFDAAEASKVAGEIESLMKSFNPEVNDPNRWRRYRDLTSRLPKARLADRIAATIKPELVAAIRKDGRTVFSTAPNRMQKPMPVDIMPDIQQYIREQAVWAETVSRLPLPIMDGSVRVDYTAYSLLQDRRRVEETPAKALLVLSNQDGSQAVTLKLNILNASGRTIATTSTTIQTMRLGDQEQSDSFNKQLADLRAASANEEQIELSKIAQEFRERSILRYRNTTAPLPPISDELRNAILNPEKIDPLRLGVTDILFSFSKNLGLQVVAAPGDFMLTIINSAGGAAELKASQLFGMLKMLPQDINPIQSDEKWFVCNRADFSGVDEMASLDRAAYGKIMRQIGHEGRISLDARCQIALLQKSEYSFADMFRHMPQVLLNLPPTETAGGNIYMLRLHGLLTRSQKETLANEGRLVIGSLSPPQQQAIFDLIFKGARYEGDYAPVAVAADPSQPESLEAGQWMPSEPTELFPNGLPRDGFVTADLTVNAMVMVEQSYDGQFWYTQPMDAQSIGFHLAMRERPGNIASDDYYARVQWRSFHIAEQTSWNYTLHLAEKVQKNYLLHDIVGKGAKVSSLDQLPEDIQAKIKRSKDDMVKSMNQQQKPPGGGGGGGAPAKL